MKRDNPIRKTTGKGKKYRSTKSGAGMTKAGVARLEEKTLEVKTKNSGHWQGQTRIKSCKT